MFVGEEESTVCVVLQAELTGFGADQLPLLSASCTCGLHASQDIILKINIGQPTIKRLAIASNFIP